jgi:hypothetical protein
MATGMMGMLPADATMAMDAPTMSANALGSALGSRNRIERNPRTPLADTVRPKPKWYEVVGRIGDVMALMGDRQPLYSAFSAQEAAAQRQAQQEEELAMQRNALAQFIGSNPQLQQFSPLAEAGMGLPEISQVAGMMGGGEKMTSLMQEVAAATGFRPGTPEFQDALSAAINNRSMAAQMYGNPDVGFNVNQLYRPIGPGMGRPQQAPPPQAQPQQAPANNVVSMQDLQRMAQGMGSADAMMGWMRRNGVTVRVSTPQEAMNLPSGTPILLPDGTIGSVP